MIPNGSGPLSVQVAARRAANAPRGDVGSWEDLYEVKTAGAILPWVVIWVDRDTGERRVTRLLESSAETDTAIGIQRPRDWTTENARVWFLAG